MKHMEESSHLFHQKHRITSDLCLVYETFGDCRFGISCKHSHDVSPYQTQKAVGTVGSTTNEIPGVIEFHIKDEKGTSTTQCYIAKGPWFNAGATSGDLVEFIISEKKFQDSDFRYARVTKILERALLSNSQNQPYIRPTSQQYRPRCQEFMTYSYCERGTVCGERHVVSAAYKQTFYIAKVLSLTSTGATGCEMEVELKDKASLIKSRKYHLPHMRFGNVAEGNLVIVQESSRIYQQHRSTNMHYGKIAALLHYSQELEESDIPLEETVKFGFTLRLPLDRVPKHLGRKIVTTYSMGSCSDHDICKRIGIHVQATALGVHFKRIDKYFVPFYRAKDKNNASGFVDESIRLAVSMYAHSVSKDVEGPILTPLYIRPGPTFSAFHAAKYKGYLEQMWDVFAKESFVDNVVNSLASNDIASFPETWRERILTRQMTDFFNKEITKYLRSKEGKFVIARNISLKRGITTKEIVVIPAENLKMVETSWQSPHSIEEREKTLGFLLGSAKRTGDEYWEEMLSDRYVWKVLPCDHLQDSHSVIATSPVGQIVDFLNQQTVLSLMISPHSSLYSKNDILGILVRRYHTPVILKSVIRHLSRSLLQLQLCGIFGRRRGNPVVMLEDVFHCPILSCSSASDYQHDAGISAEDQQVENMSLILEGLNCEEYCNSKLVRLSGEKVAQLARTSIDHGVEADKTAEEICELLGTKIEYDSPYELHERGTMVSLSCGVELQLQVSLEDDDLEFDHWLRLLRVGKDCHLCLVHINTPGRAFLCGRRDVKDVISENSIKEMREKIASNRLKTVILTDIHVKWNDVYFSGGTFTSPKTIKPRSLLCIRKEIISTNKDMFIWTCHAVVSEICDSEVTFLSCSLFQDQTEDMWDEDGNGHFIVEVLDTDESSPGPS